MATLEQKLQAKKQRQAREHEVCAEFIALTSSHPEAAPYSIFETMAEIYKARNLAAGGQLYPATTMGVRNMIIRNGLYKAKR